MFSVADAAVTPDIIAVMRPEGDEPLNNDISERLLDATGLLALERIEKRELNEASSHIICCCCCCCCNICNNNLFFYKSRLMNL